MIGYKLFLQKFNELDTQIQKSILSRIFNKDIILFSINHFEHRVYIKFLKLF